MLVVFNTDEGKPHELYTTLNPNLRAVGETLRLLFSYTPESEVKPMESPRYALPSLKVKQRSDVLCTQLALHPASIAIYTTKKFPSSRSKSHPAEPDRSAGPAS